MPIFSFGLLLFLALSCCIAVFLVKLCLLITRQLICHIISLWKSIYHINCYQPLTNQSKLANRNKFCDTQASTLPWKNWIFLNFGELLAVLRFQPSLYVWFFSCFTFPSRAAPEFHYQIATKLQSFRTKKCILPTNYSFKQNRC